ncbi:hypothetical protein EDC02_7636 [Micromonospora sp. Llam0]|uniref:SitI3 family protein n=1 Tax=Micromonospora sp. Llam0 TaxID=2485143 RepID=UPI000F494E16|nr:SitI3 family protein [Micromonospora sp. Llam0]ROO52696.1 hypothetical protein EDC02_7636 [Micromonospora sp. Llam0]
MALEYRLTLAGDITTEQIVESAAVDPAERATPTETSELFTVDLYDQRGFVLIIRSGRNGYYEADNDGSTWEWEPDAYVNLTFRMSKEDHIGKGIPNMLATVARVLASRAEDAALILNSDVLLLTRMDGAIRKHRQSWWHNYGVSNLIPE